MADSIGRDIESRIVLALATEGGDKASRELIDYEKKVKEVSSELTRMTEAFDGTKSRIQAETMIASLKEVGGTSKLTAKELQALGGEATELVAKFRAMGDKVPAELQKIADAGKATSSGVSGIAKALGPFGPALAAAFSVGAIVGFGQEILGDADALMRMSDQTGIGVVALQQLKAIAKESGNDVEQLTAAVSQMQNRLAEGDSSAVGAVGRLGLSLETLKGQAPDQQFLSIARAIAQIQDPMERTRTAMDLFGRAGAQILPSLRADVDGIIASTTTMSEETVKKLDAAGDAWERFKTRVKVAVAEAFLSNDDSAVEAAAMVRRINKLRDIANGALPDTLGLELGSPKAPANAPLNVPGMPSAAVIAESDFAASKLAKTLSELAAKEREAAAAAKKLADEHKRADEIQQKFLDSIRNTTSEANGAKKSLGAFGVLFRENAGRGEEFANVLEGLEQDGTLLTRTLGNFGMKLQDVGLKEGVHQKQIEKIRTGTKGWRSDLDQLASTMTQFAQISGDSFGGVIQDIANIVVSVNAASKAMDQYEEATTSAGKAMALVGAAAALIQATTPRTSQTVDPKTGAVTIKANTAATVGGGAAAGATIGSTFGPWGTVIGGVAGGLIGWIRSNKAKKQINEVRQAFVDAAGGLDELNKHAHDSGTTLDALLNAKTPAEYNKAITELTATMAKHDAQVKRVNDGVEGLSKSWEDAGEYIPREVQGIVDQMTTMNGLTQEQRDLLASMSSAAEPNYKKLTDLAHNYGIELADLGPQFQQFNINDTAAQIFKDFDQITRAGGDVVGVLFGMTDEIQKLISDSAKFGTTIPDNMKPLIENLINAGKLTDDAGVAITDISQIRFGATPLDRSTSAIVDAVHELRDALLALPENAATAARGMNDAFNGVRPPTGGNPRQPESLVAGGLRRITQPTLAFSNGQPAGATAGVNHIHFEVQGREFARVVLPDLYDQARLRGAVR